MQEPTQMLSERRPRAIAAAPTAETPALFLLWALGTPLIILLRMLCAGG
jgi:hypothetical protein